MVDKNAPRLPEYTEKFNAIFDEYTAQLDKIMEGRKQEGRHGRDNEEVLLLHKQLCVKIKALQKEYPDVFVDKE